MLYLKNISNFHVGFVINIYWCPNSFNLYKLFINITCYSFLIVMNSIICTKYIYGLFYTVTSSLIIRTWSWNYSLRFTGFLSIFSTFELFLRFKFLLSDSMCQAHILSLGFMTEWICCPHLVVFLFPFFFHFAGREWSSFSQLLPSSATALWLLHSFTVICQVGPHHVSLLTQFLPLSLSEKAFWHCLSEDALPYLAGFFATIHILVNSSFTRCSAVKTIDFAIIPLKFLLMKSDSLAQALYLLWNRVNDFLMLVLIWVPVKYIPRQVFDSK